MSDSVRSLFRESRVSAEAARLYADLIRDHVASCGTAVPDGDPELLNELAGEDWIALDDAGNVSVLYPFSLVKSGTGVRVGDCSLYAMCAIDALGIPPMLLRDVTINAVCPASGGRLEIHASADGTVSSIPDGVVVLRRRQSGAAHLSRCEATRFFRLAQDAETWREEHGQPGDVVLPLDEAMHEASAVFGRAIGEGVRLVL